MVLKKLNEIGSTARNSNGRVSKKVIFSVKVPEAFLQNIMNNKDSDLSIIFSKDPKDNLICVKNVDYAFKRTANQSILDCISHDADSNNDSPEDGIGSISLIGAIENKIQVFPKPGQGALSLNPASIGSRSPTIARRIPCGISAKQTQKLHNTLDKLDFGAANMHERDLVMMAAKRTLSPTAAVTDETEVNNKNKNNDSDKGNDKNNSNNSDNNNSFDVKNKEDAFYYLSMKNRNTRGTDQPKATAANNATITTTTTAAAGTTTEKERDVPFKLKDEALMAKILNSKKLNIMYVKKIDNKTQCDEYVNFFEFLYPFHLHLGNKLNDFAAYYESCHNKLKQYSPESSDYKAVKNDVILHYTNNYQHIIDTETDYKNLKEQMKIIKKRVTIYESENLSTTTTPTVVTTTTAVKAISTKKPKTVKPAKSALPRKKRSSS